MPETVGRLRKVRFSPRLWAVLSAGIILSAIGCGEAPQPPDHLRIIGGDASRGRLLIASYECGSCHRIQGIRGAHGVVGPPLTNYAQRTLLAGILPNVPRTLVPWLINPVALDPDTAMPNLGISEPEARDIATYLYTLGAEGAQVWPSEGQPYGSMQGTPAAASGSNRRLPGEAAIERAMDSIASQAVRP